MILNQINEVLDTLHSTMEIMMVIDGHETGMKI